ncbi:MFS transporter [Saccharopolyspora erythraea]|uniref:Integral membrane transport protein n=2 Tax=Saccharopolyspora erythraea TaxID=1836 RepID=A4FLG9_SACEN|nr:MFS transporter [Saccharopolyspora erythraea]EQD85291.1 transporter [Saccharopolyspora erythraea D]QRK93868.1 MFS transporter [Saccharopolyspora erythraea]CAM04894.1 integral membrane transport protein [Saccharopolyspora erythraea NRRL 2338]
MVAVALGTFTVVTSEMLPVGLLTPIGAALGVSEGTAGLTLTITGLVAAVTAPLLTPVLGRFDRRAVLVALMSSLAAANLLAAWSPGFEVMVVARVLVGVGMGAVWAISAGIAARLVPARSVGPATSLVFSGIAMASVLGVPAGSYVGELAGWQAAFVGIGALASAVAVAMLVLLPKLPAEQAVALRGVPALVRNPRMRTGLVLVGLVVAAHFAAYTYVRPALEELSGAGAGMIGTLLLAYGIAGVLGNFAAGAGSARSPRATLVVISAVLAATLLLVPLIGGSVLTAGVLLVVWGLAYGGVSVSTQTWVLASVPEAREAGSALFVGVFNAVIALGALVGGQVVDAAGVGAVMYVAGGLALAALAVAALGKAPASGKF